MKGKNKTKILISFLFLGLLISVFGECFRNELSETPFHEDTASNLKTSGFWVLTGSPIYIDDSNPSFNWSKTASENDWCSGSGSFSDPYVIENVTIDGQNSGNCIEIRNSYTNFVLRNCTVYNSQGGNVPPDYQGIYLLNVLNATLEFLNSSNNNGHGIVLENCNNSIIQDSIFENNQEQAAFGIDAGWSHPGVMNLTVRRCKIRYNAVGLRVTGDNNNIYNNTIEHHSNPGVSFGANIAGNFNNFFDNRVYDSYTGIWIDGNNNTVWLNNFSMSSLRNANHAGGSTKWDNGTIGNYWDDYVGVDRNDDLIGDTPYGPIYPTPDVYDNFPIKNDGPDVKIDINSPTSYQQFGKISPNFDIAIQTVGAFNYSWYIVEGSATKYFFTGTTGAIDQSAWNSRPNGSVLITFWANDSVGYDGYEEIKVWKSLYPVIYINSVDDQTENYLVGRLAPDFNIFVLESERDSMWYSLNGGTNTSFTSNTTINQVLWSSLSNGTVTLTFYVNDTSAREGRISCTIYIDIIAPSIVINIPQMGARSDQNAPNYELAITDANLDSIWYNFGGQNYTAQEVSGTLLQSAWDRVPPGSVTLTFYANDTLGNTQIRSIEIAKEIPIPIELILAIVIGAIIVIAVVSIVAVKRIKKIRVVEFSEKEMIKVDKKNLDSRLKELDDLISDGMAHYKEANLSKARNYWVDALNLLEHIQFKAETIKPKIIPKLTNQRDEINRNLNFVSVKNSNNDAKNYENLARKLQENQDYNNAIDAYKDALKFYSEAEDIAVEFEMIELTEAIRISKTSAQSKIDNLNILKEDQVSRPDEVLMKELIAFRRETSVKLDKIQVSSKISIIAKDPKDLKRMIRKIIKKPEILKDERKEWIEIIRATLEAYEVTKPPKWQKFIIEISKLIPKVGDQIPDAIDFILDFVNKNK